MLKAIAANLGVPDAGRYSSHSFRMITAQELKEAVSPLVCDRFLRFLAPPAFRGYVDLSKDVDLGPQNLFDFDLDSDS